MSVKGQMNVAKLKLYRSSWNWAGMRGSGACIQWNARDLVSLDTVMKLVPGRTVAVQAGGNLGLFPKRLAEEFKTVYTFEPDAKLFECMLYNAPESNIVPVMAALGCSRDTVSIGYGRRDGSGRPVHEGLTHIAGPGDVPQMLIDDLNLETCDLIYLDIEGYEFNALRGAEQTIARCRPVLALELNGNVEFYGFQKQEIRDWLTSRGYVKVARLHGDDVYLPEERQS